MGYVQVEEVGQPSGGNTMLNLSARPCCDRYSAATCNATHTQVTLPTRFLLKTAHLVSFLALSFDIDAVTASMNGVSATGFSSAKRT